jgi:hypothetical protein
MARLGPAIHVLVVAQESTTVKLQSLTGIGLMGHIKSRYASARRFTPRLLLTQDLTAASLNPIHLIGKGKPPLREQGLICLPRSYHALPTVTQNDRFSCLKVLPKFPKDFDHKQVLGKWAADSRADAQHRNWCRNSGGFSTYDICPGLLWTKGSGQWRRFQDLMSNIVSGRQIRPLASSPILRRPILPMQAG